MAVQATTIQPQTFTKEMRYSATVKELQKVDLSFKVAGTVQELYQVNEPNSAQTRDVQVGDAVPSESVLARLDDADYRRKWNAAQEQLLKSKSQLSAARADADLAEKDLKRSQALSTKGAGTQENLDAAKRRQITANAALDSAQRDVDAAEIAEQQAKDDLDNCCADRPAAGPGVCGREVRGAQRTSRVGQECFSTNRRGQSSRGAGRVGCAGR